MKKRCHINWYTNKEYYKTIMEIDSTTQQNIVYMGKYDHIPNWHIVNRYDIPNEPHGDYCIIWKYVIKKQETILYINTTNKKGYRYDHETVLKMLEILNMKSPICDSTGAVNRNGVYVPKYTNTHVSENFDIINDKLVADITIMSNEMAINTGTYIFRPSSIGYISNNCACVRDVISIDAVPIMDDSFENIINH